MPRRSTAEDTSPKRNIMPVALTPEANRNLNALADRLGRSKTELLSLILEWMARMPALVQHYVCGLVPPGLEEAYASAIAEAIRDDLRPAGEVIGKPTPAQPGERREPERKRGGSSANANP